MLYIPARIPPRYFTYLNCDECNSHGTFYFWSIKSSCTILIAYIKRNRIHYISTEFRITGYIKYKNNDAKSAVSNEDRSYSSPILNSRLKNGGMYK